MANNKKRAGKYNTKNIKTSKYLPGVFQTNLNKKWLDSTLDQMVSKGELNQVDGFVGSKAGSFASSGDTYISPNAHSDLTVKSHMAPAIVSRNKDGSIDQSITFDDVARKIAADFDTYNYNAAYTSESYTYLPPIDIDKFINYQKYYWVDELPVYTSYNETSAQVLNPVTDSARKLTYTIVDDNNTFNVENNMLIRFIGAQWDPTLTSKTYIVTGVGKNITMRLYIDENGKQIYNNFSKATVSTGASQSVDHVVIIDPNSPSKYVPTGGTSIDDPTLLLDDFNRDQTVVNNADVFGTSVTYNAINHGFAPGDTVSITGVVPAVFNLSNVLITSTSTNSFTVIHTDTITSSYAGGGVATDVNRPAMFDGYDFVGEESNTTQFILGKLIRFVDGWGPGWTSADKEKVYVTELDVEGNLTVRHIANYVGGVYVPGGFVSLPQDQLWIDLLAETSDDGTIAVRDYILIDKNCLYQTAWSRSNHWVNRDTINKLKELIGELFIVADYVNSSRRAQRPIIEFNGNLTLFNHVTPTTFTIDATQYGVVDYILPNDQAINTAGVLSLAPGTIPDGSTVLFETDTESADEYRYLYQVDAAGDLTALSGVHLENVLANIKNSFVTNDLTYENADIYYNGSQWIVGQQKVTINQAPLYQLYTPKINQRIQDYPGAVFEGNKIFGYKIGSGLADPVLGFPLSFKDSPKGAEYEFENFILTSKYTSVWRDDVNPQVSQTKDIPGYYFFQELDSLAHIYTSNKVPFGAKNISTYEVKSILNDIVIPHGYNNWRSNKEVILYQYLDGAVLTEVFSQGLKVDRSKSRNQEILVNTNETVVVHNLIKDNTLSFATADGTPILTDGVEVSNIAITVDGTEYTIVVGDANGTQVFFSYSKAGLNNVPVLIASDNADKVFYDININGKMLDSSYYTIGSDTITIETANLEYGDLIDLEYKSNDNQNSTIETQFPQTQQNNSTNRPVETFTISETISHWKSLFENIPDFVGDPFGENNYSETSLITGYGGTMFVHEDLSITHDINYASNSLSVTGALIEQGNDWDSFRTRFKNQVRRLYATKPYTSTLQLVNDAIESIIVNRKGGDLYKDSNMVFNHIFNSQDVRLLDGKDTYYLDEVINGDTNIRDHQYVYLTDKIGGVSVQRMLTKDVDYVSSGNKIRLRITPTLPASIQVHYHQMDEESYVPPSPVKLGVAFGYTPQIAGNTLVTHDGLVIELNANADLENINSEHFDPVNAALYDLERRIYTGLKVPDEMYRDRYATIENHASAYDFIPSCHRTTWYTLAKIDNYTEQYYAQWAAKRDITDLNIDNYFDIGNAFTWNYSSITMHGHVLPGHWKGAYTTIFGTSTPHLTPWHMLGHAFKPLWWDESYSWTDAGKRAALLEALELGIVSNPLGPEITTSPDHARYNWNWSTECPVDISGDLVSPDTVLDPTSQLTDVQKAANFVFGDWGPVEIEWRNSASGYMSLLDAIVKLSPAKAWTKFIQPGSIKYFSSIISNLTYNFESTAMPSSYLIPGETYGSVIKSLIVTNASDSFDINDTNIKLVGPTGTVEANTYITTIDNSGYILDTVEYKKISAVSLLNRGFSYPDKPSFISTFTESESANTEVEIILDQVPFVSNGILQAQHNYKIRNQYEIDLAQIYNTLETRLAYKFGGFTNSSLVNFALESSSLGPVVLSDTDYTLKMYEGAPTSIVVASNIIITKSLTGFIIDGISSNLQEFKFYEPDVSVNSGYENISVGNTTVRKYRNFAGVPSTVEFKAEFSKVQDTYNFIRGYWHWLRLNGYEMLSHMDSEAFDFADWAMTAETDQTHVVELGNQVTFNGEHGSIKEYNSYGFHDNDILDATGDIIDLSLLSINRQDNTVTIETKDESKIGSISSVVLDYEHIAIFNNINQFGITVFDDTKGSRYHRMYLTGQITADWTGQKKSLGYLIKENGIVQNFDSSVSATDDYYRTDVTEFNPSITKAKDLTIGNYDREWISNLGLNKNTVTNFYQGAITDAGTNDAINRISRTSILDHGTTQVSASEQFMFSQSYIGDTSQLDSTEVTINPNDIVNNPQIVSFTAGSNPDVLYYPTNDTRIINQGNTTFDTIDFADSSIELLTAGEVLETEATYSIIDMFDLETVYDSTADYATIPTWNQTISYKLGQQVRYNGKLYKCIVDSTGLSEITDEIELTGVTTDPLFDNGTIADIAGISTTLNAVTQVFADIDAVGTVLNPTLLPSNTLSIDGTTVTFTKNEIQNVVIGDAVLPGNISGPVINDPVGKTITIGSNAVPSIVIDFDTTPANKNENFTGVDNGVTPGNVVENIAGVSAQQTYTISQAMSPSTYSISTVTVDGTPYVQTTDWTISGQDITFTNPIFAGSEVIVITLTHVTVVDLEDTFTIVEDIVSSQWEISTVTVDGTPTTQYTVSGQDLIFDAGHEPADGVAIVVTLAHTPVTLNTTEICDLITTTCSTAGASNITCSVESGIFQRLVLTMTSTDPTEVMTLSAGSTNEELGFNALGATVLMIVEQQIVDLPLTLTEVVQQINAKTNLPNITASDSGNILTLSKTITSAGQLLLAGDSLALLGLNATYNSSAPTEIPRSVTFSEAILQISNNLVANAVTDVFVTNDNNRVKISTARATLDIGTTDFNTEAGLPSGVQVPGGADIVNESPDVATSDWNDTTSSDPANINIWIADDSAYEVEAIQTIKTKYYGWNVLQAQNQNYMHTIDASGECGICAGTTTSDGNDAQVTVQVAHNLEVGDYVMLVNTTTTPNIDGVHRVTKLHTANDNVFYIDRYIEKCGDAISVLVMRSQRFETIAKRDDATTSSSWNIPTGSLAWTNEDESNIRSTNVYKYTGTWTVVPNRKVTTRVTNADLKNAFVYSTKDVNLLSELEIFDPMRGIIPGVADRELDAKSAFDSAIYNTSTDANYATDINNAWGEGQIGKRWWNTINARYYDYDQGSIVYKSQHWGKLYPGSEIEIYEWTKSTVAPDDYADAIASNTEMFGNVASGEAYGIFDEILNETLYYYTTSLEWNAVLGKYTSVYYFWVKNKETISTPNRMLTAKAVGDIITDPTSNGIGWIAVIDGVSVLVGNMNYYLSDDSSVLQINRKQADHSHNSWTLIGKDIDIIPDYWYIGLRNNYARKNSSNINIPFAELHPLNKVGDDRAIGQAWFSNIEPARRNAVFVINDLFKQMNMYGEYLNTWNSVVADDFATGDKIPFPSVMWDWTDYMSTGYNPSVKPTLELQSIYDLQSVDTSIHTEIKIEITSVEDQLDRSEFYSYYDGVWNLTKKNNGTVKLDADILTAINNWDMSAWDSINWDSISVGDYWVRIINALRNQLFVANDLDKFNKFFFATVEYTLATENLVTWAQKSTYIKVGISQLVTTDSRRYKRNMTNTVTGYINVVKPFHTKISEITNTYITSPEEANLQISIEQENINTTLKYQDWDPYFSGTTVTDINQTPTSETIPSVPGQYTYTITEQILDESNFRIETLTVNNVAQPVYNYVVSFQTITFDFQPTGDIVVNFAISRDVTYSGGDFGDDTQYTEILDSGALHNPLMYNHTKYDVAQLVGADVRPLELVTFTVQTNEVGGTSNANSRTFRLVSTTGGYSAIFGLEQSKETTLASELTETDTTIDLTDGSSFATSGIVAIRSEFIRFIRTGNTLTITERSLNGTLSTTHQSGTSVVDVTDAKLSNVSDRSRRLNEIGKSILEDSNSIDADDLQALGQGIEL